MDPEQALHLAASLCRRFEGLYTRPYLCPAGVPTIGYGTTYYEDGRKVSLLDPPITASRANDLLMLQLRTVYMAQVLTLCPGADTSARLAALVDFAYNLGGSNLRASTLRRRVNSGDWDAVPPQLMRWTRAAGKELPGLVLRRRAEVSLV